MGSSVSEVIVCIRKASQIGGPTADIGGPRPLILWSWQCSHGLGAIRIRVEGWATWGIRPSIVGRGLLGGSGHAWVRPRIGIRGRSRIDVLRSAMRSAVRTQRLGEVLWLWMSLRRIVVRL